MRKLAFRFWYWLFCVSLYRAQRALRSVETGYCANRSWTTLDIGGKLEVKVTWRDKRCEDGYARDELLMMLREVRKHEDLQGWKVPE